MVHSRVALGLIVLALTGCRLGVTADASVGRDGSGTATVELHLDDELLDELDALGVDPTVELEASTAAAEGWTFERIAEDDGLTLVARRPVADAAGFGPTFRELSAGLADADPALLVDIEVLVDDDGGSSVAGTVSFRPPATAGATLDGDPLGPAPAELAALTQQSVAPRLVVTLPGRVASHDADGIDGRTLAWDVPIGDQRPIAASAAPPRLRDQIPLWAVAVAAAALLVAGSLAIAVRRRRRVG